MNFLLELLSEEIPPTQQRWAAKEILKIAQLLALERHISIKNIQTFHSSQRLVLMAELECTPHNSVHIIKGPKVAQGPKVLEAFLKKQKASLADIRISPDSLSTYFLEFNQTINSDANQIKQNLTAYALEILQKINWSEVVSNEDTSNKWIRPLRSITALYQNQILEFYFLGIRSGRSTYGHKTLTFDLLTVNQRLIEVESIANFESQLESQGLVIFDQNKRQRIILELCEAIDEFKIIADRLETKEIIEENVAICEFPNLAVCYIPERYIKLPKVLISHIMGEHQRFIALEQSDSQISNKFIVIVDHERITNQMLSGFEKVLNARLDDGKFFWERDLKQTIPELLKLLEDVPFHKNLGNIRNKVQRIDSIIEYLGALDQILGKWFADNKDQKLQAIEIKYLDLGMETITEYPKLAGKMIPYYMKHHNLTYETLDSQSLFLLSIAEKIHELVALLFVAGEISTGSFDPFALRRTTNLLIDDLVPELRIENNGVKMENDLDLHPLIEFVIGLFDSYQRADKVMEFEVFTKYFFERLNSKFCEYQSNMGNVAKLFDFTVTTYERFYKDGRLKSREIFELGNVITSQLQSRQFTAFIKSFNRISRIISKKHKESVGVIDEKLFETEEERRLWILIYVCIPEIKSIDNVITSFLYLKSDTAALLGQSIENFLDNVHIDCPNPDVRSNRIALVKIIFEIFEHICDFDALQRLID